MTIIMRMSRIHSLALITVFSLVWGCDVTANRTGASHARPSGPIPAGSGDVNVRTPGVYDPDDVKVDIKVKRDELPAGSSAPRASTLRDRREERRERLGEAIDRIDVQVEANGADVNVE
jgi:hypothetical protein